MHELFYENKVINFIEFAYTFFHTEIKTLWINIQLLWLSVALFIIMVVLLLFILLKLGSFQKIVYSFSVIHCNVHPPPPFSWGVGWTSYPIFKKGGGLNSEGEAWKVCRFRGGLARKRGCQVVFLKGGRGW